MPGLFPPIEPYFTGRLLTTDGVHDLYYEQSGSPHGKPVIFCHGGPGSGSSPLMRQFFDPAHFCVILMDQRGCGQSRPSGSLERNTPAALVADMEQLRAHLGHDKWAVMGGSWGCTLALLYACMHPDRLTGLCVGGVFLARPTDSDWLLRGVGVFFPEAREKFYAAVPGITEGASPMAAYARVIHGKDRKAAATAARVWGDFEDSFSLLLPPGTGDEPEADHPPRDDDCEIARTKIMLHYLMNDCFFSECFASFEPTNHTLLDECAEKLQVLRRPPGTVADGGVPPLPVCIIQGRYDMVCPPHSAWELHRRALPQAKFIMVPDAGHSYRGASMEKAYTDGARYLQVNIPAKN